jgi:hypothetical protein
MKRKTSTKDCGCGCNRREFINVSGTATLGFLTLPVVNLFSSATEAPKLTMRQGARVKTVFIYPPSKTMEDDPEGWWSWPGTEFNAEGHQRRHTTEIEKINAKLGMNISIVNKPVADVYDVQKIIEEIKSEQVDGLLLFLFHNWSITLADSLLLAAEELGIPSVFYIELGVKHGPIRNYQRPGIYFIQAKNDFDAVESGMRMINAREILKQSTLLSISDEAGRIVTREKFLGITTKPVPFDRYAKVFHNVDINSQANEFLNNLSSMAIENNKVSKEALENATRAYFALKRILEDEDADAVTMNCLRRGMLKPCIGFSMLNNQLIPATCENDFNAAYGQMLAQSIVNRPGFQHNPAYNTEENRYYASHCTCPTKLSGPEEDDMKYRLTRFLHTNEGSCAIQVFWQPEDRVTMIHYYSGQEPKLDVYSGTVFKSHQELVGCATNVEINITDRKNVNLVQGHHNILLCGDWSKVFKDFARLHKLPIMEPESMPADASH